MRKKIVSKHFEKRNERLERMINDGINVGKIMKTYLVDTGHKNGLERHSITETGLIFIVNNQTDKLITFLIARPGQIERYFRRFGENAPDWLLNVAYQHMKMKLNY